MLLGSETALLRMSHVLLGMIVRRYELRMKVQSHRSWDAGSRLGHDTGFKSMFPHLRSYCYRAEQRLYPHCFSWMYPHHSHQPRCPFRDQSKPMFMYRTLFKSRPGYQLNPKKTKIKSQISHWSKASDVNEPQQIDVALLQDFSAWVCKAALLQFHYAAGKIHPENKTLLVWNGFPVYCDIFFFFLSDSCLAGCPKLTFLNTVWEAVSFVDVTK